MSEIATALPTILERNGFANDGAVSVTSMPNIEFTVQADAKTWDATFNDRTGALTGVESAEPTPREMSVRSFLLRLHLSHGYPGETDSRWLWAVIRRCNGVYDVLLGLVRPADVVANQSDSSNWGHHLDRERCGSDCVGFRNAHGIDELSAKLS